MNKIELAKYLSQKSNFDYLNSSIDDMERKRRLAELTKKFESQFPVSLISVPVMSKTLPAFRIF